MKCLGKETRIKNEQQALVLVVSSFGILLFQPHRKHSAISAFLAFHLPMSPLTCAIFRLKQIYTEWQEFFPAILKDSPKLHLLPCGKLKLQCLKLRNTNNRISIITRCK